MLFFRTEETPMRLIRALLACLLLAAAPAGAQSWYEPARGSAERGAIMDAVRPVAGGYLGAPVEFVVEDLRVAGDRAYADLNAHRPGGVAIDMAATPRAQTGYYSPPIDRPNIHALLLRQGGGWGVAEHAFSPTEPPFYGEPWCGDWRPVLPTAWC